ncbi:MAG: DUF4123 domain-containing protein [Gemmatimonadota bacterium]
MSTESQLRLEGRLWPKGFSRDAWMIVDASRDRRIYGLLLECFYSQHTCLFAGNLAPELKLVAPYLVQLDHDYDKTRRFIGKAWGNSWGVFLKCDSRLETLRRHLRTLLLVRGPSGNRLLFRYYDPRVLRVYLPTCTEAELHTVFGPIDRVIMEDDNPDTLLEFNLEKQQLVTTRYPLNQRGEIPPVSLGALPRQAERR